MNKKLLGIGSLAVLGLASIVPLCSNDETVTTISATPHPISIVARPPVPLDTWSLSQLFQGLNEQLPTEEEVRYGLLKSIDQEISQRNSDIDKIAKDLYETGCFIKQQDTLDQAYILVERLDATLNTDSIGLGSVINRMELDTLDISGTNRSLLYTYASIRYQARCSNLDADTLIAAYHKYRESLYSKDCDDAIEAAESIGDYYRSAQAARICKGVGAFYRMIRTLEDKALIETAKGIPVEEYDRWRRGCEAVRRKAGMPEAQTFVSCIADLASANGGQEWMEARFPTPEDLGILSEDIESLILNIPADGRRKERECALLASGQEAAAAQNTGQLIETASRVYHRCLGQWSLH